jgi:Flp pilus assembly protein TadG
MAAIRTGLARFGRDRGGVAAVEFAFIAPILLAMYFLTMEVSQAIETNKKLSRIGSMVADLVTQQGSVTKDDLDAIMKIADSTLLPYQRSNPRIIITGISIGGTSPLKATVDWSRKVDDGTYSADVTKGTETTLPTALMIANSFVVRVESQLGYTPVIAWAADSKNMLGLAAAFDNISMGETYYLRPRMTSTISCSDCYK